MAEAKSREAWAHTSVMLALTANCHRDPKKTRPFTPADFNPHERGRRKATASTTDITILKQVFVDKEKGR